LFALDQIVLAPEPKTFRGWSRSQKFWIRGTGARNLSSGSTALGIIRSGVNQPRNNKQALCCRISITRFRCRATLRSTFAQSFHSSTALGCHRTAQMFCNV